MMALAWPLVALVGIGAVTWLVHRWVDMTSGLRGEVGAVLGVLNNTNKAHNLLLEKHEALEERLNAIDQRTKET